MEEIRDAIIINELMDDVHPNINIIGNMALELAEPLILQNQAIQREAVPRNNDYFEVTIPQYMGDLFIEHFRMSRGAFEQLTVIMRNTGLLPPNNIPLEKKLLFSLWILAKPESFLAAGDRFGLAKSTAHNVFKEVVGVLVALIPQYIVWPDDHAEAVRVFHERSNGFPGIVGAIDGCHIPIKQPTHNANDFYNRKHFHSIILQGICDHRMVFLDIYVGAPGRVHDARVFHNSDVYQRINDENHRLLDGEHHIIGDTAYPLLRNLMTPFRDNGHLSREEINYNMKLSSVRSVIERAYGRLKGKFRRLKYLDVASAEFGTQIIAAACVLHNYILINNDEEEAEEFEGNYDENVGAEDFDDDNPNVAVQKRRNIVNILNN